MVLSSSASSESHAYPLATAHFATETNSNWCRRNIAALLNAPPLDSASIPLPPPLSPTSKTSTLELRCREAATTTALLPAPAPLQAIIAIIAPLQAIIAIIAPLQAIIGAWGATVRGILPPATIRKRAAPPEDLQLGLTPTFVERASVPTIARCRRTTREKEPRVKSVMLIFRRRL